jgi:hypothetical protein
MQRLSFLVLVVVTIIGLPVAGLMVSSISYANTDFFKIWLTARLALSGQDAYSQAVWIGAHATYGAEWVTEATSLYPLPLGLLFSPLGALDLFPAYVLWTWLTVVMLTASALLLLPAAGSMQRHYILPVLAGIACFRPTIPLLLNGQLAGFFLFVCVLVCLLWEKGRWFWGGALLSLLLLKPNVGAPVIALACLYLLANRRWSAMAGIAAASLAMLAAGLARQPNWVAEYVLVLLNKNTETFGFSPTVWGLAAMGCGFTLDCTQVAGSVLAVGLVAGYAVLVLNPKRANPPAALALAITAAVLVTPYIWPYDQILLALPILLTMAAIRRRTGSFALSAMVFLAVDVLALALLAWSAATRLENPNSILPLVVLGLQICLPFRPGDREAGPPPAGSPPTS